MGLFTKRKVLKILQKIRKNEISLKQGTVALDKIGEEAAPFLFEYFLDSSRNVRETVIQFFSKKNPIIAGVLMLALQQDDGSLSEQLCKLLSAQEELVLEPLVRELIIVGDIDSKFDNIISEKSENGIDDNEVIVSETGETDTPAARANRKRYLKSVSEVLKNIGKPAFITMINYFAQNETNFKESIAAGFKNIGVIADPFLMELSNSEEKEMRALIAELLGFIGDNRFVDTLIKLSSDSIPSVRGAVAWSLGQVGGEKARATLISMVHDENSEVRSDVAEALGFAGDEQTIARLFTLLDDSDWAVRDAAVWSLGELGFEKGKQGILNSLKDPEPKVRITSIRSLDIVDPENAVKTVFKMLDDPDPEVKCAAIDFFENHEVDKKAKVKFWELFNDSDFNVRMSAQKLLRQHGEKVPEIR